MNDQLDLLERIAVALEALAASRQNAPSALGDRVVALKVERNGERCFTRNGEPIAENPVTGRLISLIVETATHSKYGDLNILKLKMLGIDGRTYLLEMGGNCTAAKCLTAGISRLTQLDDITIEAFGGNDGGAKSVLINTDSSRLGGNRLIRVLLYQKGEQVRSSCRDWTEAVRDRAITLVERLSSDRAMERNPSSNRLALLPAHPVGNPVAASAAQPPSVPQASGQPQQPMTDIELINSVNKWVKTLGWSPESWLKWLQTHYNTVLLADLSPEQLNQIRATLWKKYQQSLPQGSA